MSIITFTNSENTIQFSIEEEESQFQEDDGQPLNFTILSEDEENGDSMYRDQISKISDRS